jgi:hypothetical protein
MTLKKGGKLSRKPNKAVLGMMRSMSLEELEDMVRSPLKKKKMMMGA